MGRDHAFATDLDGLQHDRPDPVGDARGGPGLGPRRWPWAQLVRRVFALEALVWLRCSSPGRILGAVTEPPAVRRLLAALGLAPEPPPDPVVFAT